MFLLLWLAFLVPALPVGAACRFFGRRRTTWFQWEYTLLVAPFAIWSLLIMISAKGKSLSNAVAEPFFLGCGVALICIARVVIGKILNEKTLAISLFTFVCLLAIALWKLTPMLPE